MSKDVPRDDKGIRQARDRNIVKIYTYIGIGGGYSFPF